MHSQILRVHGHRMTCTTHEVRQVRVYTEHEKLEFWKYHIYLFSVTYERKRSKSRVEIMWRDSRVHRASIQNEIFTPRII